LRIGIDYTAGISQGAGIGRYTRGFVRSLAKLDPRNQYVLFHASPRGKVIAGAMIDAPNFHRCGVHLSERTLAILWHRLRVPLPINVFTGHVDLFHAPDYTLPPVRRAAAVVTVHDLSFLLYPECADHGLRAYLERAVLSSVGRADFVVVDSLSTRNDLICLLDVPPTKVAVVYPGLDERFHPLAGDPALAEVKARWGLERPFILNVGTLEPRKNQARLIQAYALLKERTSFPHQLVIAGGRGWLCEDIFRRVNELGLKRDIHFLGYTAEDDLPALYSLADLFVFPSLYEGFGLPPLEAMACGTPVVVSNSSSLPEVVGDAAIQVRPVDTDALATALEQALGDHVLRQELRAKGLARARLFTWEAAAQQLLGIYENF